MDNTPKILKERSRYLTSLSTRGKNLISELQALESQQDKKTELLLKYHDWLQRVCNELTLLEPVIGQPISLNEINLFDATSESVAVISGKLNAIYLGIGNGQFNQLVRRVQKNSIEELLVQADDLMNEDGTEVTNYHLAAICVAITLEHAVRKLCEHNELVPENEKWQPLGKLLDMLKDHNIFNEHTYNKLDNWRKIRNDCVHGNFDKITKSNVSDMIEGVKSFVKEYL